MKILFDGQIFNLQRFGGISRYFTEVIYEINHHSDHQAICPVAYTENIHFRERITDQINFPDRLKLLITFKFSKKKRDRYFLKKNQKNIIKALKAQDFDVFVPTYYDTYFLPHLGKKPFVLNVYDMIHEIFPHYFLAEDNTVNQKEELLNKADKVIAISESTKNDILKFYPKVKAEKIEVVYLSQSLSESKTMDLNLPTNYVLFVGNRGVYKNFNFFFKAIAPILATDPNLFLVCAGGNNFSEEEQVFIESFGFSERVIQRNFKDAELTTFYKSAKCFVFPSAYEGFGIPVLEAMNCGCPVILANHSSFPEVAGDAGIYFELNNEVDLESKIRKVVYDVRFREEMSIESLKQSEKFNWQKTAQECIRVFKSMLN